MPAKARETNLSRYGNEIASKTEIIKQKTKDSNLKKYGVVSTALIPEIKEALLEHKQKIENNKKLCGNSYIKDYKDYICVNEIGKIFRPEYVTEHFTLIMNKNKDIVRKIRFHDLRHSCASLLLAKWIPLKEIQDWLGHSIYSTTDNIYSHLEKDTKNKSANVLSNTLTFAED